MAAEQTFTSLNEVKPFKTQWTIKTKILHSWRSLPSYGGESLDMILADQAGTLIHATIKKQQIQKFFKYIKTGEWRTIEHFTLSKAMGKYRATNHIYKMALMNKSIIKPAPSVTDDWYFNFVNFQDITNDEGLNENILIDVLGQVVSFSEIKIHDINNKPTKKLELELRDTSDERLPCTLWERFAETMLKACENAGDEMVICLIRFAKINSFNGARSITNAYDSSLLEINPNYPVVDEFVANLPSDGITVRLLENKPKESKVVKKKEYFNVFPRKTISDLGEATEVGKCKIMCTINTIDTEFPWYYFQCLKCSKTAHLVPKKENEIVKKGRKPLFNCQECNEDTYKVVPRYRLIVGVMDSTGDAKCMLFDNNAFEILGQSANDLLEGHWTEIQDPTNIPKPLRALIGKTFQFLVSIGKDNINEGNDTFKVTYVWLGNDKEHVDIVEESDAHGSYATNDCSNQKEFLALTNSSGMSESVEVISTTPNSKKRIRADGYDFPSEQSSCSKKPSVPSIKGVIEKEKAEGEEEEEEVEDENNKTKFDVADEKVDGENN